MRRAPIFALTVALSALTGAPAADAGNPSPYVYRPRFLMSLYTSYPAWEQGFTAEMHDDEGPFIGTFSLERGHAPGFTRTRMGWFGLGVKHAVPWLSGPTRETAVGLLADYGSCVDVIDSDRYRFPTSVKTMATLSLALSDMIYVRLGLGREYEFGAQLSRKRRGPLPERTAWLAVGSLLD